MSSNIAMNIENDISRNINTETALSLYPNTYNRSVSIASHPQINRIQNHSTNYSEFSPIDENQHNIYMRSNSLPIQLPANRNHVFQHSSLVEQVIKEEPIPPALSEPSTVQMHSFNAWYRRTLPDYITCHHVWLVLHSLMTLTLLVLYFRLIINITAGTLAIIQLLVSAVVRNEPFVSILHRLVACIPCCHYILNRMLHCIGGIHVSSAISACIFLCISLIVENNSLIVKITGTIILLMIMSISLMAIPVIRRRNHNIFERFHRYIGWTSLLVLVVHIVFIQIDRFSSFEAATLLNESVIMTFLAILIVFLPWIFVRKVYVSYSQPSKDLTIVTFPGAIYPYGSTTRISLNGREWHAFAIALTDPFNDQHSIVVAAAGDWTKMLAESCQADKLPAQLWVRRIKGLGFMYSIHAYQVVLIVCTGAGIAPALPYIKNPLSTTHVHLLWIAKQHEHTYGEKIWNLVQQTYPNFTLHDTSISGRPNEKLVEEYFWKTQSEAVFVVANEKFTNDIVNALWRKGIPCFGALFDS